MKENFNLASTNQDDCIADLMYVYYDVIPGSQPGQEIVVNDFVEKKFTDIIEKIHAELIENAKKIAREEASNDFDSDMDALEIENQTLQEQNKTLIEKLE